MDIIKVFADNVKKYRKEKDYSQEKFAELCGMHRTYISALECYRRSISLENIQRIADVCKKAADLGFEPLDSTSDPNVIGAALLKHWQLKVEKDALAQGVTSRRIFILLKTEYKQHYAVFEEDMVQYSPEDLFYLLSFQLSFQLCCKL